MSLLDDNLDLTVSDILSENIRFLADPNNYTNPWDNSLFRLFRGVFTLSQYSNCEFKIHVPKNIPDKVLIGWDYLCTSNMKCIQVKLFDLNKFTTKCNDIVYTDDDGKNLYYYFNRITNLGKIGGYRLHMDYVYHPTLKNRMGFLVLDIEDIINKYINKKYYIRLPVTSMETYLIIQNKTTDHLQIFTEYEEKEWI